MGNIVDYVPKEGNKIQKYINSVFSYQKQGKTEIAERYLKTSVPEELQTSVREGVNKIIREYNENIST